MLEEWAPLTVVRGPQGYGKTVLVASWLERQPRGDVVGLWLSANQRLADPVQLWDAVRRGFADAGLAPSPHDEDRHLGPGDADEITLAIPSGARVVLVIDDFQHVRDQAVLRRLVGLLQANRSLHLCVCHRAWHPIQSLAAASLEVQVVTPGDLLLDVEEISRLAAAMGKRLAEGDAGRLLDSLGGWFAAVRLVFGAFNGTELPMVVAEEYMANTVLSEVDAPEAVDHLMRFALARRLDQELVRDLSDDANPEAFLEMIESAGLLERRLQGTNVALEFPAVLQRVLSNAYSERHPADSRAFHRRLAVWYLEHGEPLLALSHAVDGEHWTLMKAVWVRHGPTLQMLSSKLFRDTLNAVPENVLADHPGMLIDRLVANVAASDSDLDGRIATIRTYFEASTRVIQQRLEGLPPADMVYVGTGHLIGLRMLGRFDKADEFAEDLSRRLDGFAEMVQTPLDGVGWFYLQRGLTRTLIGDDRGAVQAYRQAWEYCSRIPTNWIPSNIAANLALSYVVRGDTRQGEHWLNRYRWFETSTQWAHFLVGIGAQVATGMLALDRLDPTSATPVLDRLGDGSTAVELWPFIVFFRAQYALHYGDPGSALADLDSAQRSHDPELSSKGAAIGLLTRARADLLMAAGHGIQAGNLLEGRGGALPMAGVPVARLKLLKGEDAAARSSAAHSFLTSEVSRRDRLDLLLIQAVAAFRMGDGGAAARLIGHALDAYRQTGILRSFLALPVAMRGDLLEASGQRLQAEERARLDSRAPIYPDRFERLELTKRERAVLAALERTGSRQEIADELYVSLNTVKTQLNGIYRKLKTATRTATLNKAYELGLLP